MDAGLDLGGTNTRAIVVDGEDVRGRASEPTPDEDADREAVAATLRGVLAAACEAAGIAAGDLDGVGVAVPGQVDDGVVIEPVNVPVDRVDVPAALPDVPVTVRNDAAAGALGDRAFGDGPEDLVYLTVSTGIGAGAIVDGSLLAGVDAAAGEVGHVPVVPDGRDCTCGGAGCWEAYCAGRSIPELARSLAAESAVPTTLPIDDEGFSARTVLEAVDSDPLADAVADRLVTYNARGLTVIARAYAPALVTVGGGVGRAHPWLLEAAVDRLPPSPFPEPTVRSTPLGEDAVLWGAVAACRANAA